MTPIWLPFGIKTLVDISAKRISVPYLSFPFKNYRYEIINQPLKWMAAGNLRQLQDRLQAFAAIRLGYVPQFSIFADQKHFTQKVIIICSDRKTSKDYCFGVMYHLGKYQGHRVIHLGPLFSAFENRGLAKLIFVFGLMYTFLNERIIRHLYLTNLTHVPRLGGIFWDYFQHVYPAFDDRKRPMKFHLDLKEMLLNTYLNEWNLPSPPKIDGNFVIKGFRKRRDGSLLYEDSSVTVPKHRNPAYNDRILSLLDYANGDEILQICEAHILRFFNPLNALVFLRTK